jgi:hypothetical protein
MPLTTIASFREAHLAHIARAKLEAADIPVFIADEHLAGVHWLCSDAIGGVKIQVPDAYADQARELVGADLSDDLLRVRRGALRARRLEACPACDGELAPPASRAREVRAGRRQFTVWTRSRSCRDCGRAL